MAGDDTARSAIPHCRPTYCLPPTPNRVESHADATHLSRVPFVRPLLVALVSVGCLEQMLRDGERCFQVALDAISCG